MPRVTLYWNDGFQNEPAGRPGEAPLELDATLGNLAFWQNKASSMKIHVPCWVGLFSLVNLEGSQTWIEGTRDIPAFSQLFRAPRGIHFGPREQFNDECESVMITLDPAEYPPNPTKGKAWRAQSVVIYDLNTPFGVNSGKKGPWSNW